MTNDVTNHDISSSGVPEMPEGDLARLLSDAYDVPPVPGSLLKRIDQAVAGQWGSSHVELSKGGRRRSGTSRWLRAFPIAATISGVVLLAVVLSPASPTYAWAAMLKAIAEQGVVQLESSEGVRWLSLSEGVLGRQTQESSQLLDFQKRYFLWRRNGSERAQRYLIPAGMEDASRDQLMVSFLLGEAAMDDREADLTGLKLVEERWERTESRGRKVVLLHVRFDTQAETTIRLRLTLDPETHLPRTCEVARSGKNTQAYSVDYPEASVAQFRERAFPPGLAIVESGDFERRSFLAESRQKPAENVNPLPQNPAVQPETLQSRDDDANTPPLPLVGAPSSWKSVVPVSRPSDEVVEQIDALLAKLWADNKIDPTDPADDEELLRRVYLDLAGRTPSVTEVRQYLSDESPDRYEKLVGRLLDSPDHASHLATVWRTFLIPEGVDLASFGGIEAFDRWLADRFASNDSYAEIVRSLLLAEGRLSRSGPLLFYSALKLDPDQLASRTSRVFLGMRLECAQCHDHPFEPWTQKDFWGYAAFFAQISRPQVELETVSTVMRVQDVERGEVKLPETDVIISPKFLDEAGNTEVQRQAARRKQLAQWLTSAENPYFARATANRVWGHLFGKGIVDPVDDFGEQNKPKSPELLELLAGYFISQNFDLRELFRTVALSRAYRLSSGSSTPHEESLEWFAQMRVKTLTAEQVYDCITVATLFDAPSNDGTFDVSLSRYGNSQREEFLRMFRTPTGRAIEYQGGIPQALTLMNGTLIDSATGVSSSGLLKSLEAPFFTDEQRVEVLYLATLSRHPRDSEWEALKDYFPKDATEEQRQEALSDLLWVLLNSAEFTMNH